MPATRPRPRPLPTSCVISAALFPTPTNTSWVPTGTLAFAIALTSRVRVPLVEALDSTVTHLKHCREHSDGVWALGYIGCVWAFTRSAVIGVDGVVDGCCLSGPDGCTRRRREQCRTGPSENVSSAHTWAVTAIRLAACIAKSSLSKSSGRYAECALAATGIPVLRAGVILKIGAGVGWQGTG